MREIANGFGGKSKKKSKIIRLKVLIHLLIEESDYYKDLGLELSSKNYWAHFKSDLEDRVRIYEDQLDSSITPNTELYGARRDYTVDLMHEYASLTSTGERNKRECLRQLESRISKGSLNKLDGIDLDENAIEAVYHKLSRTRESKFIKRQKQINERAFDESWTDVEVLNLLKGIIKCGEHDWSEICDKYDFQSFRTPNSLAYKWNLLKLEMLEDIQSIYNTKTFVISKLDWIQCFIHKLELKCEYHIPRQLPAGKYQNMWPQKNYINPTPYPQQELNGNLNSDQFSKDNLEGRDNNCQDSFNRDKKTNVIQELCNNYDDCMKKFKESIELGNFSLDEVRKYISGKSSGPLYPKYFELHYVEKRPEEIKRPVFKLHPKENLPKSPEIEKIEKKEHPLSLKKMFLQKKKAQLNCGISKEENHQESLNN